MSAPAWLIIAVTWAIVGIAYCIGELRPVRLFFLRRLHARVIREVEAEMQAEYGENYMPDPGQAERVWRQVLRIHGLE